MENKPKIDLVLVAKSLWRKRVSLIKVISIFLFFGLFIALISPRIYSARSVFIPQSGQTSKASGSLDGLASLAGINLGNMEGSNDVHPMLYPQFLSSTDFRKQLIQTQITIPGTQNKVSYQEFYEKHYNPGIFETLTKYSVGLPGELIKLIQKKPQLVSAGEGEEVKFLQLTFEEFEHFKRLDGQLSVVSKEKEGVVELVFSMKDPLMAAEMAQSAETLLQKEVISFKVQNAKEQLKFTEERFKEKKEEFEQIQSRLAYFRDRNQNVISAALLNQQQKLEAEYDFAFGIYTELAKQLEQAKLQVAKDTPVFSVIQQVTLPIQKSSPNRPMIVLAYLGIGIIISLGFFLGKEILVNLKKDWAVLRAEI
jgi:LPS O-antigen subunit length determinant protein (WzzB/FepE family)